MINCKQASSMVEKKHEQNLGTMDRFKLAFHLLVCKVCAVYAKQSTLIENAIKRKASQPPSQEELSRIKSKIKEQLKF